MGKKPSVIEINNKRYDAITGQLIGAVQATTTQLKSAAKGPVIDGLINNRLRKRKDPAAAVHHRAQRSRTLMRAPHKPIAAQPQPKKAEGKFSQAMGVAKSSHVRHFSTPNSELAAPKPSASSTALALRPMPGVVGSLPSQRLERMLDEAFFRADAHRKARSGKNKGQSGLLSRLTRLPNWALAVTAALVLLGSAAFVSWHYVPQVSMKVAAMRARVNATLPAYVPSGYKFAGPVAYSTGAISLKYQTLDGKSLLIEQQASSMNSSSLAANNVPKGAQVQTSSVKGTTVYIYDSSSRATWVNNGVRYTIKDASAKLSSGQLLKIADSL